MNVSHYVMLDGQQQGPFTISQLRSMWDKGNLTLHTQHYMDGYNEWHPLEFILEDLELSGSTIPLPGSGSTGIALPALSRMPAHPANAPAINVRVPKSRGTYIILGIFLGLLGIHNFYAGRMWPGFFQLLITLLIGWLILPLIAVGIWMILELCLVEKDGKGQPLG